MMSKLKPQNLARFLVRFIQIIVVFPMAVLISFYIPPVSFIDYEMNFLLCVVIAAILSVGITALSRKLIVVMFFGMVGFIFFSSTFTSYSVDNLYSDYNAMLVNMTSSTNKVSYFKPIRGTYFQERRVKSAMQPTHPVVRNFAVENSTRYFHDEYYRKHGKLVRYFSLFKHIRLNWKYVNDPVGLDYYSPPTESISLLAGDCDDYAILMASSIMAIGGEARVVISSSHMYTEVKVGKVEDLDNIGYVVRTLFPDEVNGGKIHFHETNGDLWINFDYTAHYPGGPFLEPELYSVISFNR
ncbi:transglutaminase domain-containing protein [Pontibacter qinzhouensis]|uniref:Transglutaminase domain-containing protein n=1 Tax=Pontibacter qinzhouensis TaxID=2603253 RepID=A0A5C8K6D2_9BACT|nr:transglutaminase-like domain-containing protein [Pontibacter qinzhouensis]TXK45291.1 transglutaminase domain-containing protein [Pontibacter qinzhouensis]